MTTPKLPTILIVDDTPANLRLLAQLLADHQYEVRPVTKGTAALAAVRASAPDLILLDIRMPDLDGYSVCEQLKADEATRSIPIIFLSALGDTDDKLKAFQVGGVDYITKPFHPEEVLARVRTHLALEQARSALEVANRELKEALVRQEYLARTDWLTGVLNRSHFFALAVHNFNNAVRYHRPLALMMFDIDHFKQVNDRFGHPAGDLVLQEVARATIEQMRSADVIGRYGGEEFIVLLPNTGLDAATTTAERLREQISQLEVATERGVIKVTVSIGVAEHRPSDESIEHVIDRVDQALYAAKAQGRNCVVSG
ncbi:diguanylate cyclase [Candidatus Chloroploca asiatica]|uniref:Diguanylate cyclase response regulator n=1 Tax=Candidatus Chloroploca asiatica TaxID=1506545 RepID=A0A2H3L3M4_9CHLR|nr:diguanylate cyclase [Candidatus Chloroploca asiatica]PDV99390.1 diguanylate cyclase response regulator [Candidatus Chloroploca asiatica]